LKDFPGKVCVVGLPCHLAAIRKAQRELPHLREKIAFTVGLFCSGTPGYDATEAFLRFHGISRQQVASFAYRWRGWPGDIRVETADGRIRNFPRGKAAGLGDRLRFAACFQRRGAFAARRCLLCPDHTAELADVSLGDPWHKAYRSDKLGLTAAIVRSPQAGSILGQMVTAGRIFLEKIDATRLLESQQACLASKKRIGVAIKVFCTAGRAVPVYTHQPDLPCNMWDRLSARFEQVQTSLARRRRLWWLLPMLAVIMAWLRRKSSRSLRQNP
jgi:coenzyme F420 hydrogenase subunit beta